MATDGLVVIPLTFNGTDLVGEYGGCLLAMWFRDAFNNIPSTRGEDITVPHRTGRVAGSRKADVLALGVVGWLSADEAVDEAAARAAFRVAMTDLQSLFATLSIVVLSAELEDGSTATINVRVKPPVLIRETIPGLHAELDVELESIDPYWVITPAGS